MADILPAISAQRLYRGLAADWGGDPKTEGDPVCVRTLVCARNRRHCHDSAENHP